MQDLLDLALKRIDALEKKMERYYQLLKVDNELSFIMHGTYLREEDMEKVMSGNY